MRTNPRCKHTPNLVFLTQKVKEICYNTIILETWSEVKVGAQWLSGRVLDSRPKGRGFEPHRRHCVMVLEQDTFILA